MKLYLPLYIGLRYIGSKRSNRFISFVSGFSLVGMVLGTLALIVVMSVMNGFDREIKQRLMQVVPHVEIFSAGGLENWRELTLVVAQQPLVNHATPYIAGDAMVSFERGMRGVQLRGLSPEFGGTLALVKDKLVAGGVEHLQPGEYNVIIGRLLARYLGVVPGDKIHLTLPQLSVTPAGIFPRVKRFTVVGVFEVGAQVDQNLVIMELNDAQKLLRMQNRVSGIEVRTIDLYQAAAVAENLKAIPAVSEAEQTLDVRDWSKTQGGLFAAVKMEKTVVSTLLMIIIAIASFNIISSLVLMVADKRTDIAVLRTLGLSRAQVMAVFVVQGTSMGLLGVLLGGSLGSLIAQNIGAIVQSVESALGVTVFDPQVYFISRIPSQLMATDVVIVITVGILLSFLSTLYPAYTAARIEPAEALRYE